VAAHTAEGVRQACQQSRSWLNPAWQGRPYVKDLYDHAGQFVRAKQDPYYPRRESGDLKRVTFFARAMAGIAVGISPSTAVDRLRKLKHGPKCPCVHCDMERWDRMDRTVYRLFFDTERKSSQKRRKK
jgi:hypothetical protein